ncbi:conserved protein of unknown function [Sterolibacterium denitrificans]|uniref:Condensation domain-containing protein n=1 Tax=Sterolibacterium denitrificans TaxID=157592 RepID=A0A7Z7HSW6_9PROT|nr:hypothetical protein [Sterolibacterium denitrificans]SMB31357.1 conserved protein of unknown function [Sterolibacterium denitrificans]
MAKQPAPLPPLAPVQEIDRLLTASEYYHACIGHHPATLQRPREVVSVIEGELAEGAQIDWQAAIDQVAAANPGCRLRLHGKRRQARWRSDGHAPGLRLLPDQQWDSHSSLGADFIYAIPLSLEEGRGCELIIAGRDRLQIIFRAAHAVMDGTGVAHFMSELFRAIRGEPLLGTNAAYTDVELMRQVKSVRSPLRHFTPPTVTGQPQGTLQGGLWRRFTVPGPLPHLVARFAHAAAEYVHRTSNEVVRIAIPINLKRHVPELLATTNFTSMLYLDIAPGETLEDVKTNLQGRLERNVETNYPEILELIRFLPFPWLDKIVSLNEKNYTRPKTMETAVLSVGGPFKRSLLSGGGFRAETIFGLPQTENTFLAAVGFQGKYEILVGMSHVFAGGGRFEDFLGFLEKRLQP